MAFEVVTAPVFFDPTGKRRRAVNRASTFIGLGAAIVTTIFVVSLLVVPFLPQFPGMANPARRLMHAGQTLLPRRSQRLSRQLLRRSRLAPHRGERRALSRGHPANRAASRSSSWTTARPTAPARRSAASSPATLACT